MPDGAMEISTSEKRSAVSVTRFTAPATWEKLRLVSKNIAASNQHKNCMTAEGTLVLRLRAGARLVYKLVDRVDERVSGHGTWWDMHHGADSFAQEEFPAQPRRMLGRKLPKKRVTRRT